MLGRKSDELGDSSSVFGAGAVQDMLTMLRRARRQLARRLREHSEHAESAERVLAEPDKKPDVAWDDAAAHKQALDTVVEQGREALTRIQDCALTGEQQQARDLLRTIPGQDIEPAPDGGVRLRQGVATDRVCSVTDPEMRHGHKTNSGRFDGHEAESGMDRTAELITHVEVMAGYGTDGDHLAERIAETERGVKVHVTRGPATTPTAGQRYVRK